MRIPNVCMQIVSCKFNDVVQTEPETEAEVCAYMCV